MRAVSRSVWIVGCISLIAMMESKSNDMTHMSGVQGRTRMPSFPANVQFSSHWDDIVACETTSRLPSALLRIVRT